MQPDQVLSCETVDMNDNRLSSFIVLGFLSRSLVVRVRTVHTYMQSSQSPLHSLIPMYQYYQSRYRPMYYIVVYICIFFCICTKCINLELIYIHISLIQSRVEQSTPSYLCSLYIYTLSHLKYFLLTLHHMHIYKYIFLRMVLKLSLEYLFVLYIRISYLSYTYT